MRRVVTLASASLCGLIVACGPSGSDAPEQALPAAEESRTPAESPSTPPPDAATDPPAPPPGPTDPSEYRPAPVAESVDSIGVFDFLPELTMMPVAGEWASWHPDWAESFTVYDEAPMTEGFGPEEFGTRPLWCLKAWAVEAPGAADTTLARLNEVEPPRVALERDAAELGVAVTLRRFYFYGGVLPDVPADYALPAFSAGIEHHLSNCRLGLVSVERYGDGDRMIMPTAEERSEAGLGATVEAERAPYGLGSGGVTTWSSAGAIVGVGRRPWGTPVAYGFLPTMGTAFNAGRGGDYGGTRAWEDEVFEMALEASGLSPDVAGMIQAIRARRDPLGSVLPDHREKDATITEIVRWLTARPAGLRAGTALADTAAARLTAADLFLQRYYPTVPWVPYGVPASEVEAFEEWSAGLPEKYAALGVTYSRQAFPEPEMRYGRSLADSAAAIPRGPAGWGAISQLLTFEEGCSATPVLEGGLRMVDRIRQPRFRARLSFLLGDAHASLVYLHQQGRLRADGVGDIEEVRRRARDFFVEAIEGELADRDKPWAWRYAWAMTHNQSMDPRYSCDIA